MQNNIADALPVPLLHSRATTPLEGGATATAKPYCVGQQRLLQGGSNRGKDYSSR